MTDGRDEKSGARKRPQDRLRESAKISPWSFWESLTVEELARLQNVNQLCRYGKGQKDSTVSKNPGTYVRPTMGLGRSPFCRGNLII